MRMTKRSEIRTLCSAPMGDDVWLTIQGVAQELNLSIPAVWKGIAAGRLPKPAYPAPRAPRILRSELRAAVDLTRAMPREAMAARRAAKAAGPAQSGGVAKGPR